MSLSNERMDMDMDMDMVMEDMEDMDMIKNSLPLVMVWYNDGRKSLRQSTGWTPSKEDLHVLKSKQGSGQGVFLMSAAYQARVAAASNKWYTSWF